jgi:small subunit ribosomal protein S19
MARAEFIYRGKTLEELKNMSTKEFSALLPARARRTLTRGFTEQQKKVLKNLKNNDRVETHCRDMIIIPEMLDKTIRVHDGRNFLQVLIQPEMLGHALGEFVMTRRKVVHSAPGIGATKSSASLSVK